MTKNLSIFLKSILFVTIIIAVKSTILYLIEQRYFNLGLIEFSDISAIFTGAFFVMGLLLAGTLSDFKESEKIPGEIACNLEAINDWIHLGVEVNKVSANPKIVDENDYYETVKETTQNIINWLQSSEKDSKIIFNLLKKFNDIGLEFVKNSFDKESVKGIQENTNVLRKQLTRTYTITRTDFVNSAYILLKCILFITIPLLLICQFKSTLGSMVVTASISFIFLYLYFFIKGLDNPFDINDTDTTVNLIPLLRFYDRIS